MTFGSYEGEPILFEPWQIRHMHDYHQMRAREKAPQIGFSWACAAEAVWETMLFEDTDTGFVSVDLREAQNKVVYARKFYDGLPDVMKHWVEVVNDTSEELVFGSKARPSRLTSFPASSGIRGRPMNVIVDEADFLKDGGEDVYRAGMTRVLRGYRFTMGGTVFGEGTQLDEVMHHKPDTQFSRAVFPWTVITHDSQLREGIIANRSEFPADQAVEEYDCVRGGGATDTFPPSLVRAAQSDEPLVPLHEWSPQGTAVLGYDVGKSRHPSIAIGLEHIGNRWHTRVLEEPRDPVSRSGLSLPAQETYLRRLMERVQGLTLCMDVNGIGQHMNDALSGAYRQRFIPLNSAANPPEGWQPWSKKELVTALKYAMENGELTIPVDISLAKQLRNTRLLADGRIEQPGSKRTTHYDRFWSLAYAWYATLAGRGMRSVYGSKRLIVIGSGV